MSSNSRREQHKRETVCLLAVRPVNEHRNHTLSYAIPSGTNPYPSLDEDQRPTTRTTRRRTHIRRILARQPNHVHVLKSHSIFRDVRRVLQGRNQPRRRSCRVALDRGARPAQGPPRQLSTGLPCPRARAHSSGPSSRSPRGPPYQPVTRMPYPHLQTSKAETSPRSEQAACTRAQDLLALRVGLGEPRCARGIAARGSRPPGRKGKSASFSWSIEAVRR